MSKIYQTLGIMICLTTALKAQPKQVTPPANFLVHITAFIEKRPVSYFYNLENVTTKDDNKGIWHYYLGSYRTLEEADSVRRAVVAKGYPYAYVVDVEKVRRECKLACDSDPSIDPSVPALMRSIRSIHHLLFDFSSAALRPDSKAELNKLGAIMGNNAIYHVEFKGHTDGIGTPEANQELSERRSGSAEVYLQNRGVVSSRIKTTSYGMQTPIAKNMKNGKDCPEGRKFNRRVEIFITDAEGNVLNALVDPLDIPTELLVEGYADKTKNKS